MYKFILLLATSFLLIATDLNAASRADIPDDDTAAVRYFGQWWAKVSGSEPLRIRRDYADSHFEAGRFGQAKQRYRKLARYGDKFAQFRLGLIALNEDYRGKNLPDAFAWFTLAEEGGLHPQFEGYADDVWAQMTANERKRASNRLRDLSEDYSDLALAHFMQYVYRHPAPFHRITRGLYRLATEFRGRPCGHHTR